MQDILEKLTAAVRSMSEDVARQSGSYNRHELTFAATCVQLIKRMTELSSTPLVQGTVISVLDTADGPAEAAVPGTGVEVKILRSQEYPETVNQVGTAVNNLSAGDDTSMVIFDGGNYGFYRGRPGAGQPAECEVVNRQHRILVALDNRLVEVAAPNGLTLQPGDTVMLSQLTTQIVRRANQAPVGQLVSVERVLGAERAEINVNGQRQVAMIRQGVTTLEVGHRVLLDVSGRVIVDNLGFDDGRFQPTDFKPVDWQQIGGYDEVKRDLQELIEQAFEPGTLQAGYQLKPIHGFLMHGAGGVGKTLLARAFYTALLKRYASQGITENGFFNIEGPEVLEGIVGETEKLLRRTANRARDFWQRTGLPAIILINEVDAIGKKRGTGISTDVNDTNVPMLLGLMDGFAESHIIWIFVTNRVDVLDPELIRDGRMDKVIFIPRPDRAAAKSIFNIHLQQVPVVGSLATVVEGSVGALFDPNKVLYDLTFQDEGIKTSVRQMTLGHIASGALIANTVQEAIRLALRRDKSAGVTAPSGVTLDDLRNALNTLWEGKLAVNLDNDIRAFAGDDTDRLVGVKRHLRQIVR